MPSKEGINTIREWGLGCLCYSQRQIGIQVYAATNERVDSCGPGHTDSRKNVDALLELLKKQKVDNRGFQLTRS